MTTVISVEHLSKTYRLGQIGADAFANDLKDACFGTKCDKIRQNMEK